MSKPTAYITNWFFLGNSLVGQIHNHPNQEEFQAEFQRTSTIVSKNDEWVETKNTIYKLGKPLNE